MTNYTPQMQALVDDLSLFEAWEDKYAYLIDLGKKLPALPEECKTPDNKVHGCTSQVWLIGSIDQHGHYHFQADSDAFIVKGLIALLLAIYSNQTAEMVSSIEIQGFFKDVGLSKHLSPTRSNGLQAMVQRIQEISNLKSTS